MQTSTLFFQRTLLCLALLIMLPGGAWAASSLTAHSSGLCCANNKLKESTEKQCEKSKGMYFPAKEYAKAQKECRSKSGAVPGKTSIAPKKTVAGFCCAKGSVKKTSQAQCSKMKGSYHRSSAEARKACKEKDVFCCTDGKVSERSSAECKKRKGIAYKTAAEAKKRCKPADVFCCVDGKVKKSSPKQCKQQKGTAYKTEAEAKRKCKAADVYCCSNGKISKISPRQCKQRKGTAYKNVSEAKRGCKSADIYCCVGDSVQKMSSRQCSSKKGAEYETRIKAESACRAKIARKKAGQTKNRQSHLGQQELNPKPVTDGDLFSDGKEHSKKGGQPIVLNRGDKFDTGGGALAFPADFGKSPEKERKARFQQLGDREAVLARGQSGASLSARSATVSQIPAASTTVEDMRPASVTEVLAESPEVDLSANWPAISGIIRIVSYASWGNSSLKLSPVTSIHAKLLSSPDNLPRGVATEADYRPFSDFKTGADGERWWEKSFYSIPLPPGTRWELTPILRDPFYFHEVPSFTFVSRSPRATGRVTDGSHFIDLIIDPSSPPPEGLSGKCNISGSVTINGVASRQEFRLKLVDKGRQSERVITLPATVNGSYAFQTSAGHFSLKPLLPASGDSVYANEMTEKEFFCGAEPGNGAEIPEIERNFNFTTPETVKLYGKVSVNGRFDDIRSAQVYRKNISRPGIRAELVPISRDGGYVFANSIPGDTYQVRPRFAEGFGDPVPFRQVTIPMGAIQVESNFSVQLPDFKSGDYLLGLTTTETNGNRRYNFTIGMFVTPNPGNKHYRKQVSVTTNSSNVSHTRWCDFGSGAGGCDFTLPATGMTESDTALVVEIMHEGGLKMVPYSVNQIPIALEREPDLVVDGMTLIEERPRRGAAARGYSTLKDIQLTIKNVGGGISNEGCFVKLKLNGNDKGSLRLNRLQEGRYYTLLWRVEELEEGDVISAEINNRCDTVYGNNNYSHTVEEGDIRFRRN